MKIRELFERERWKFEIVEDILFYSLKMMSFLPSKTNSFCSSYILFIYIWNRSIFDKGNWLISKRLGEQTTSTRPLISQKDDRGNNTGDIPLINWWHFQWITLPQESTNTSPLNWLVSLRWRVTISRQDGEADGSYVDLLGPHKCSRMEISCTSRTKNLLRSCIFLI